MWFLIDVWFDYGIGGGVGGVSGGDVDVLLQIEVVVMVDQKIVEQLLMIWLDSLICVVFGEDGIGQCCWLCVYGCFIVEYCVIVEVQCFVVVFGQYGVILLWMLLGEFIVYLLLSCYCQLDCFEGFVQCEFVGLWGGVLVVVLLVWVGDLIVYWMGMMFGEMIVFDVFVLWQGVCCDYVYLLVVLVCVGDILVWCVLVYVLGVDLFDFYVVVELWFDGVWWLVDVIWMVLCGDIVWVCVGCDVIDIVFMIVFGSVMFYMQMVCVIWLEEECGGV